MKVASLRENFRAEESQEEAFVKDVIPFKWKKEESLLGITIYGMKKINKLTKTS